MKCVGNDVNVSNLMNTVLGHYFLGVEFK